jgi:PAS domain S-box-containing protein
MNISEQLLHRHELILNSAGEGIYGLDPDGKGTFVNPAAIAMTGWTEADVIGQPLHQQHHHSRANGDAYPRVECPIYAALKDGKVHHETNEVFWHKNGSCFPVHYTSTPILEDGMIVGAVVVFQDVSKLKQAEAELVHSQQQYEMVLSAAGEGICGFDCEGNVTFTNPVAENLLAWPTESKHQRNHSAHFFHDHRKLGAGFVTLPQMTGRHVGMPFVLSTPTLALRFRQNNGPTPSGDYNHQTSI